MHVEDSEILKEVRHLTKYVYELKTDISLLNQKVESFSSNDLLRAKIVAVTKDLEREEVDTSLKKRVLSILANWFPTASLAFLLYFVDPAVSAQNPFKIGK